MRRKRTFLASVLLCFGFASLYQGKATAQSLGPGRFNASLDRSDVVFNSRYIDGYQISGTAGEEVSIRMMSSRFNAYLILTDAQKNIVAYNDDAVRGNGNSQIFFTFPHTGTYYIHATTFSPGVGGSYSMAIEAVRTQAQIDADNRAAAAALGIFFGVTGGELYSPDTPNRPDSSGCVNGVIRVNGVNHVC